MLNIRVDVAGEEIFIVPFVPQHMPAQDALALAAELVVHAAADPAEFQPYLNKAIQSKRRS